MRPIPLEISVTVGGKGPYSVGTIDIPIVAATSVPDDGGSFDVTIPIVPAVAAALRAAAAALEADQE